MPATILSQALLIHSFTLALLLPLVSAADLPSHPSLSVAYTSPSLTNMAQHACDMVQRERKTLANAKRLMTRLRGDQTWIPCGLLCSEMDEGIFNTEKVYNGIVSHKSSHRINGFTAQILLGHGERDESQSDSRNGSSNGTELGSSNVEAKDIEIGPVAESSSTGVKVGQKNEVLVEEPTDDSPKEMSIEETNAGHDVEITDTRPESLPKDPDNAKADEVVNVVGAEISTTNGPLQDAAMHRADGGSYNESENTNGFVSPNPAQRAGRVNNDSGTVLASENISNNHLPTPEPDEPGNEESEEANVGQDTSQAAPRRMRTRAQAQAASEPTASTRNESPESWVPPEIHPLFKIPDSAIPDKDFGLPKAEADETRRLLTMYTQKQEEVCRGAEKLYDGLLQADRQRMMVFKWCKADAHVGEMSDGEDWYDKEEWGLEEDLEKGHNDEDGDTNAIQGKKTRGRRA